MLSLVDSPRLIEEGDSKVILQREQPLSEYALTGVACSKSRLLTQPLLIWAKNIYSVYYLKKCFHKPLM